MISVGSKDTNDVSLLPDNFPYKSNSNINEVMQELESNDISVTGLQKQESGLAKL